MKQKANETALRKTLEQTGLSSIDLRKINVLAVGEASKEANARVHEDTNRLIVDLMKRNELGVCIHVTGDARAITDPFHRRVCEEMKRTEKDRFLLLYHVPTEHAQTAVSLVSWNLNRWSTKGGRRWDEELRTLSAIGERSVDLQAYGGETDGIQYSVFGHKYVLLQEKHSAAATSKRVWLLEAESINEHLTNAAYKHLRSARDIDEGWFREFLVKVGGLVAQRYLNLLSTRPHRRHELASDSFVLDNGQDSNTPMDALSAMNFIKNEGEIVHITSQGRTFFKQLSEQT